MEDRNEDGNLLHPLINIAYSLTLIDNLSLLVLFLAEVHCLNDGQYVPVIAYYTEMNTARPPDQPNNTIGSNLEEMKINESK